MHVLAWFVLGSQGFPALGNGVCGGGTGFTLIFGTRGLCLLPPHIHPCCCPHAGGLCPIWECCINTACASCGRQSRRN